MTIQEDYKRAKRTIQWSRGLYKGPRGQYMGQEDFTRAKRTIQGPRGLYKGQHDYD